MTPPKTTKPSGRFNLRVPPATHAEMQKRVQRGEADSLNRLIVGYIDAGLKKKAGRR